MKINFLEIFILIGLGYIIGYANWTYKHFEELPDERVWHAEIYTIHPDGFPVKIKKPLITCMAENGLSCQVGAIK